MINYYNLLDIVDQLYHGFYMKKNILKEIWLFISSFGIMFAILSWMQESNIIANVVKLGPLKGFFALITGSILYICFRKNL